MRHLVKGHYWHEGLGRMLIEDRYFPTFEEAKAFVEQSAYHSFKVYDHNNQLVHSGQPADQSTYA